MRREVKQRQWEELGVKKALKGLFSERRFEFGVERAIFLAVLHRFFVSKNMAMPLSGLTSNRKDLKSFQQVIIEGNDK